MARENLTRDAASAERRTITHVNAMPAPTWSWLRMNETTLDIPAGLAPADASAVAVELAAGTDELILTDTDPVARELDAAEARFGHLRRAAAPGDAADRERLVDADAALDVPALSTYQAWAIDLEEHYTPERAFACGMGEAVEDYLAEIATRTVDIDVPANATAKVVVRVTAQDGESACAQVRLAAGRSSTVELTLALDSATERAGLAAALVKVYAGAFARVHVTSVQTADDGCTALDDSGYFLDEGARVSVEHIVLGAGTSVTGLAADLSGDRAKIDVDTSYLGARDQRRDFNYEIRHRGRATESELMANGVLAGASTKCLRGTIDLVHGCRGSQGTERETVLLADDRVKNKTVPIILCDEDDVMGNHGATIGHVRPEQLFYLESRGISPEAAEGLFVRAKLEDAYLSATDDAIRASIARLGTRLFDDFEEELA